MIYRYCGENKCNYVSSTVLFFTVISVLFSPTGSWKSANCSIIPWKIYFISKMKDCKEKPNQYSVFIFHINFIYIFLHSMSEFWWRQITKYAGKTYRWLLIKNICFKICLSKRRLNTKKHENTLLKLLQIFTFPFTQTWDQNYSNLGPKLDYLRLNVKQNCINPNLV